MVSVAVAVAEPIEESPEPVGEVAALDDVLRPGVVKEAEAAVWANHLAVSGVKRATRAEGEAMGVVRTEELVRLGLYQRGEGLGGGVHQQAVDRLKVSDVQAAGQPRLAADHHPG